MIERQFPTRSSTAQALRAFLAAYGRRSVARQGVSRIREALRSEIYRRERDQYPEWIDLGGEA